MMSSVGENIFLFLFLFLLFVFYFLRIFVFIFIMIVCHYFLPFILIYDDLTQYPGLLLWPLKVETEVGERRERK